MNDRLDCVAERTFIGVRSDGQRVTIRLRIGKPYAAGDVDWACPVAVEGLRDRLPDIYGVDSLQSLVLAIGIARIVLTEFIEGGGAIFWPEEESNGPISIDEIFGKPL